jgi:hypothetical protein
VEIFFSKRKIKKILLKFYFMFRKECQKQSSPPCLLSYSNSQNWLIRLLDNRHLGYITLKWGKKKRLIGTHSQLDDSKIMSPFTRPQLDSQRAVFCLLPLLCSVNDTRGVWTAVSCGALCAWLRCCGSTSGELPRSPSKNLCALLLLLSTDHALPRNFFRTSEKSHHYHHRQQR